MPNVLGLDIGGTKIALANYETNSWIKLEDLTVETIVDQGTEGLVSQLRILVADHCDDETVAVGIGVPGPTIGGVIEKLPNIPGVEQLNLKLLLEEAIKLPVAVENDANCFVIGAWKQGNHQEKQNIVGLTLGTGVGGAIIMNGQLIRGRDGAAGEFGHMMMAQRGVEIDHLDIAEFLFSGAGLARRWEKEKATQKTGAEIVAAAEQGDAECIQFLNKTGEDFGMMVSNLVLAFNPEVILVGGAASAALPFYEEAMREVLAQHSFLSAADIPVERVADEHYATFGAAWLAYRTLSTEEENS